MENYTPYGEVSDGVDDAGPGFTGHVTDAATGLTYAQQRFYDPSLSRFLSVDPVSADNLSFNRYWYANNSPYKFVDKDGRVAIAAPAVFIPAVVIAVVALRETLIGPEQRERELKNLQAWAHLAKEALTSHNESVADPGQKSGAGTGAKEAPKTLVGEQDGKSRQQGDRVNNGPLAEDNGGTGEAADDFDVLTGGQHAPAADGSRLPAGTLVGDNGVILRPATDKSGPRIDIPASGDKPHETLHYPQK